jgi:2-iminobutanoate/2-iminopropanoate deaminase
LKKVIYAQEAAKPVGPYSQAVQAGNFLFISGQLAIDPQAGTIVAKDIASQTRQVLENLKSILQAADFSLKDVVQTTVYLSSMSLFDEFNREYAKYFLSDSPARATVATELKSGALVEISMVAYKE